MKLRFSLDISRKIHILNFNYYQVFHKWDAIHTDLFKAFQTTLNLSEKYMTEKKLQKYKNQVSKVYLITPFGSIKNSFKKTH